MASSRSSRPDATMKAARQVVSSDTIVCHARQVCAQREIDVGSRNAKIRASVSGASSLMSEEATALDEETGEP